MIRKADYADVPHIVRLGIDGLNAYPAKGQRIDTEKLQHIARTCVANERHFAWVAEHEGQVVGALCAVVVDQDVFQRKIASCVQFWCPQAGEGIKLMREFMGWARPQRKVKAIMFSMEAGADPRIGDLLERLGCEMQRHPLYIEWL